MRGLFRTGMTAHHLLVVVLWTVVVSSCFGLLSRHDRSSLSNTVGETTPSAVKNKWQLELFIHPECPCTRTSLKLVERLLSELPVKPKLTIYVASYRELARDWISSTNRQLALRLTMATVEEDRQAMLAKNAGAAASGTIVIRDERGDPLFTGGISTSRSCNGLNPSYIAVRNLLILGRSDIRSTPVYGCAL